MHDPRLHNLDVPGVPPATDEEIREVYAQYGLAMYAAQCVEVTLVMLVIGSKLEDRPTFTQGDHDNLWNTLWQRTMGARIKRVLQAVDLPDDVGAALDMARDRRNRLAHNYFFDRGADFVTAEGRAMMLDELARDRDFLFELDERLTAAYLATARPAGITDEMIAEAMRSMLAGEADWPPPTSDARPLP